jgi:hypothetical protein
MFGRPLSRGESPGVFLQIVAGLLIVATMFAVVAVIVDVATEKSVQERHDVCNAFFPS